MIPAPGETAGDWWEHTGAIEARRAAAQEGGYSETFDLHTYFLHDVPDEVVANGPDRPREEAEIAFQEPCPFACWPEVPTTVIAGRDDRFFPLPFQQRVARDRLDTEVQAVPGGHVARHQPADGRDACAPRGRVNRSPTSALRGPVMKTAGPGLALRWPG